MYPDLKLFIGGEWRKTASDLPVVNPATEEEIGRLPRAGINDLDDALDAAENGLRIWRRTAPRDRSDIIMRAAGLMRDRQEEIAQTITAEHGKPFMFSLQIMSLLIWPQVTLSSPLETAEVILSMLQA
jgi:succinate-semialdehyde dehydrogenase / glutarate-semialdehyde dehydrogenase